MAENAVAVKVMNRSLPGANLLWLGPLAAGALTASRFLQRVEAATRGRRSLQVSLPELALHWCLLALLIPAYFMGLCREILLNWQRIKEGG